MKHILLPFFMATFLYSQGVSSSATFAYETMQFENSIQKLDGKRYSVGGEVNIDSSKYELTYENTNTNTKQPPLSKDLVVSKIFAKYNYSFDKRFKLNINYLNVLDDNIAITSGTKAYGLGVGYRFNKYNAINFTQYYSDFVEFKSYQSDIKYDHRIFFDNLTFKISAMAKYINLIDHKSNPFSNKAKSDYITSGLSVHSHYKGYHLGVGAYFGKRAFAIMNDGFRLQHHAMEFNKSYMAGVGKNIGDSTLMIKYIDMLAKELPMDNDDVKMNNIIISLKYKF